ncbi:MAG TPA: hypothetical protein VGN34_03080, partial [Ktedonobacteraceae bacterium]
ELVAPTISLGHGLLYLQVSRFQFPTGSTDHLAADLAWLFAADVSVFQSPTGSTGHFACYPSSIAWEADLCKGLRGTRDVF